MNTSSDDLIQKLSKSIADKGITKKSYKMEKIIITPAIIKRFKILCLLCLELDVLGEKMQELGDKLDQEHPQSIQALSLYEDKIIKLLEV